jgi:hypothetical protein
LLYTILLPPLVECCCVIGRRMPTTEGPRLGLRPRTHTQASPTVLPKTQPQNGEDVNPIIICRFRPSGPCIPAPPALQITTTDHSRPCRISPVNSVDCAVRSVPGERSGIFSRQSRKHRRQRPPIDDRAGDIRCRACLYRRRRRGAGAGGGHVARRVAALSSHHAGALPLLPQPKPDATEAACAHRFHETEPLAIGSRQEVTCG